MSGCKKAHQLDKSNLILEGRKDHSKSLGPAPGIPGVPTLEPGAINPKQAK